MKQLPRMSLFTAYLIHVILILTGAQIAATLASPDYIPIWFLALGLAVNLAVRRFSRFIGSPGSDYVVVSAAAAYGFLIGFFRFDGNWMAWLILVIFAVLTIYISHISATWLANYSTSQNATIAVPLVMLCYLVLYSLLVWDYLLSIPWPVVRSICGLALPPLMNILTTTLAPFTTYRMTSSIPDLKPKTAFITQITLLFLHNFGINFLLIVASNPYMPRLLQVILATILSILALSALLAISKYSRHS